MSAGDDEVVAAALAGEESAFSVLVERHRRELRVHCYRMLGSFDEAEDMVQETFLRAWKNLASFEGRATLRAWLYRIATNACLDVLDGKDRRVLPQHLIGPGDFSAGLGPRTDIPWLQPFPDQLATDELVESKETIKLAFLAAIQHLPPRQRAVLILRDVLGWHAKETAVLLENSVASVNSALNRARTTLREHLPERRLDWASAEPTEQERAVLRRYMDAMERADLTEIAELLAEDVRTTMPPWLMWLQGRDAVLAALRTSWDPSLPGYVGRFRTLPTRANGQPAFATYTRGPKDTEYHAFAISLLWIKGEQVVDVVAFHDVSLFPAFGLPISFPDDVRHNVTDSSRG